MNQIQMFKLVDKVKYIFPVLGICLVYFMGVPAYKTNVAFHQNAIEAEGTVIGFESDTSSMDPDPMSMSTSITTTSPKMKFQTADGKTYEVVALSSASGMSIGDKYLIVYDPEHPSGDVYIKGTETNAWGEVIGWGVGGIFLMLMGLMLHFFLKYAFKQIEKNEEKNRQDMA